MNKRKVVTSFKYDGGRGFSLRSCYLPGCNRPYGHEGKHSHYQVRRSPSDGADAPVLPFDEDELKQLTDYQQPLPDLVACGDLGPRPHYRRCNRPAGHDGQHTYSGRTACEVQW